MRTAMKIDAIGSKPVQPYQSMSRVEMMTPTEPRVSAMTCYTHTHTHTHELVSRGFEPVFVAISQPYQKDALHVVAMVVMRVGMGATNLAVVMMPIV
jgi:hypothetical protein